MTETVTIEKCVYGGDGLARLDNAVVFVPGAFPGETVQIEIVQRKRSFLRGRIVKLLTSSRDRIDGSDCRLSSGSPVPGCVYADLAYPAELAVKQAQLQEALARLPGYDGLNLLPPVASPRHLNYRNKLTLHCGCNRDGRIALGYMRERSHQILPTSGCPLSDPAINIELSRLLHPPIVRRFRPGADVVFRCTESNGAGWYSAAMRHSTLPRMLTERTPFGSLQVPADGFFQVNPAAASLLIRRLTEWFSSISGAGEIVDLYCGVGALGLSCLVNGGTRLVGVESGRAAVAAAQKNSKAWNSPADFRCLELGAEHFDLNGILAHRDQTTVIVDPPRGGMAVNVAQQLRDSVVPRIFCVSCDPATLARDLKIILEGGYRLRRAQLFDLFPRTARFETLVEISL
ncbi:MAG: class I SAM-dependent RNA methyltransferase [Kiritimatiellae bacterium]|nr:class I SAM-dependent RNA methyltransferase [Kiritimatiellia bacterium]